MLIDRIIYGEFIPGSIGSIFARAPDPESPQQALWREVIARATLDALGFAYDQEDSDRGFVVAEARRWFKFVSEDLETVFSLAGMEYEPLRTIVLSCKPYVKKSVDKKPDGVIVVKTSKRRIKKLHAKNNKV